MRLPSVITDTIAAAIAAELRRQHADIVAERDAAAARAAAAEAAASAARAAVLDLEAAIAGMSRGMAERDAEVAKLRREIEDRVTADLRRAVDAIDRAGDDETPTPPDDAPATVAPFADPDRPTMAELQDRKRAEEIATVTARRAARGDAPAGQGKTKRNPDRNADRGRVLREALRGSCPTCEAPAGKPCHDDDGGREVSPHPDRIGAARKRLAAVTARLSVRCPTCDAPEGVPCVVDGRKGLHTDRQVKP